jgi:hypothetical protein
MSRSATTVQAGQLLAEIDPTVLSARVDASTRRQLRNLRAQPGDRESQLVLAQIQLRRQRALMAEDATTTEACRQAEASAHVGGGPARGAARADRADRIDPARRRGQPAIRPHPVADGRHRGVDHCAPGPDPQHQPAGAGGDARRRPVHDDRADPGIGSRHQPPALGMEAYFTTLGGSGKRWHGKLREDRTHAHRDQQRGALQRALRRTSIPTAG